MTVNHYQDRPRSAIIKDIGLTLIDPNDHRDHVWHPDDNAYYEMEQWTLFVYAKEQLEHNQPYTQSMLDELEDPRLRKKLLNVIAQRSLK